MDRMRLEDHLTTGDKPEKMKKITITIPERKLDAILEVRRISGLTACTPTEIAKASFLTAAEEAEGMLNKTKHEGDCGYERYNK